MTGSRPNLTIALATALVVTAGACSRSPDGPAGDVVLRWIEDDPQDMIELATCFDTTLRMELSMERHEDRARWELRDLDSRGFQGGALRFKPTGPAPQLVTEVDLDADDVAIVEVDLADVPRRGLKLYWSGVGQQFSERSSEHPRRGEVGDHRRTFRFEVADNPAWRGRIGRLRLDLGSKVDRVMGLIALRALGRSINDAELAEVVGRPWKVAFGNDARSALPGLPGLRHDRRLTVPDGAALVFGFGLQPAIEERVRFVVEAIDETGGEVTLFDRTVGTDGTRHGSWHNAELDLGAYAGREVTLRLATAAIPGFDVSRGLPFWSNPEVVAPGPRDRRPNVIVILLDTLRADHLSSHGYVLPTSPAMDRWAAESAVRFRTVVAPAPWTLPSHASIFTGLDAMRHGFNYWGTAPVELEMVAETLRNRGFTTAAITGGGVMLPSFGYAQGFDTFEHWNRSDEGGEIDWVFGRAAEWLSRHRDRRFFLFVHTYEVHFPHRRREPYFSDFASRLGVTPPGGEIDLREHPWTNLRFPGLYFLIKRPGSEVWEQPLTEPEIELVRLMYDSAIRNADSHVEALLQHLNALGLAGETAVILTSDHGEELGDDRARAGHAYVSEANVLVPLMIALPDGRGAGTVVDRQVRLIDLQPTILDLVGIEPPTAVDGRSLVPVIEGQSTDFPDQAWTYAASSNLGLALRLDGDLKYLFPNAAWSELAGADELYDLASDPAERRNLAADDPRVAGLRRLARDTIFEQHRGVRLEIRNGGDGTLSGVLTGAWAAHDRVKTADHGCGCVSYPKGAPPSFAVPAGKRTTLLFEGLEGSQVGIEIRLTGAEGLGVDQQLVSLDLSRLKTPAGVTRTADGWGLVEGLADEIVTGFAISRHGPEYTITGDRADTTPESLEQLRALGYVQ